MSFKNTPSADKLNGLADDLNSIARDGLDPLSVVALDEAEIVLRDYAELSLLAEHTVKAFLRFTAERPDA